MNPILEENKHELYNFLLNTGFKWSDPENCNHVYSKVLGLDVENDDIWGEGRLEKFNQMGLTHWLGAHLIYFYDAIVNGETDEGWGVPYQSIDEKVTVFNTFIWKISKSVSYRSKPWEVIERNIKVNILESVKLSLEKQSSPVRSATTENLEKALKVCRQENGFNGPFVDLMNFYLSGLDTEDGIIDLRTGCTGEDPVDQSVSRAILWSICWDIKQYLGKRLPKDMNIALPVNYMQDAGLQEIFIAEIRAK